MFAFPSRGVTNLSWGSMVSVVNLILDPMVANLLRSHIQWFEGYEVYAAANLHDQTEGIEDFVGSGRIVRLACEVCSF